MDNFTKQLFNHLGRQVLLAKFTELISKGNTVFTLVATAPSQGCPSFGVDQLHGIVVAESANDLTLSAAT